MLDHIFGWEFDGTKPDYNESAESVFEVIPFEMQEKAKVKHARWWFEAVAAKWHGSAASVTFVIDRQDELLGLIGAKEI